MEHDIYMLVFTNRFWHVNLIPTSVQYFQSHNIGIQMKWIDLTKTFMMILKKTSCLSVYIKIFYLFKGYLIMTL